MCLLLANMVAQNHLDKYKLRIVALDATKAFGRVVQSFLTLALDGVSGHCHALVALPPGWNPRCQLSRKLDEPQARSGGLDAEINPLLLSWIEPLLLYRSGGNVVTIWCLIYKN
jgi:hypothetical protein